MTCPFVAQVSQELDEDLETTTYPSAFFSSSFACVGF
jgi:hypothetical protein